MILHSCYTKVCIVIMWLSTIILFNVQSQDKVRISGSVIASDNKEPLYGASVYMEDHIEIGTTTNDEGTFELDVPSDLINKSLLVTFIGFENLRVPVKTILNGTAKIQLRSTINSMDEVVISAEKLIAEEFSIQKIRKIQVYLNPSSKADPILAVNSMPAATTTDESANISLRGSSPVETGIFLDNVPIYDAVRFSQLNGIGTFSIFNTSIIDNVQVFPGNPPLEYGNVSSGLITLQTDENIPMENSYSMLLSLANIGINSSIRAGENSVLRVFSNAGISSALIGLNQDALRDLKKFNSLDLGIHYFKKIDKRSSIKLFNYSIKESYQFRFRHPSFDTIFDQEKMRNFTVFNYRIVFGNSELSFNQGLSASKSNFGYSRTDIDIHNDDFYSAVNYQIMNQKWHLKSGLTYDFRRYRFNGTFPQYGFAVRPDHPFIHGEERQSAKVPEAYIYYKNFISESLIFGMGYRKNLPINGHDDYSSAQLNLNYKPQSKMSFTLGMGQYHKQNLGQTTEGRPLDQLIRNRQLSLDIKLDLHRTKHQLSLYSKHNRSGEVTGNINGIEYQVNAKLSNRITGNLSYALIDAHVNENNTTYASRYDLDYFFKGNLQYNMAANWTLSMMMIMRQGTIYEPIEQSVYHGDLQAYEPFYVSRTASVRYPSYKSVDLSITKLIPVSEDLTMVLFANSSNVFNFENVRSRNYDSDYSQSTNSLFSQRTFYFGAVFNF